MLHEKSIYFYIGAKKCSFEYNDKRSTRHLGTLCVLDISTSCNICIFLFCLLPLQLKFTVSVQQLWQNLFRLLLVFERNGSQLPATRRFISNELYSINRSCTWFYWLRFWVGVLNKFKIIQIPWAMTKKILVFFTVQN